MNPAPGRICPAHYGYSPRVFSRAAELAADTLYVVGGLYGNRCALDAIEAMACAEPITPRLVFNGDFHWFDATPAAFTEIDARVRGHLALRGNVETELAATDDSAGCGCAYPEAVGEAEVARSNAILARLKAVAQDAAALGALPMHLVAQVGGLRLAIVHGDAWSLAGWRFSRESLFGPQGESLAGALEQAAVDGFACSHTCTPALRIWSRGFVINNGAAGMGNVAGNPAGLITRVSTRALPASLAPLRAYGLNEAGVWVDALEVRFDLAAWLTEFDATWPAGSPAAVSYRERIRASAPGDYATALGRKATPACVA